MNRKLTRNRRGASAVEFALTLPALLMILFASYEFSRANMMLHTAEAAAYEGARVGIIPGATANEVRQAAQDVLGTAGIRNSQIVVVPANLDTDTETVSVTISFEYGDNSTMFQLFMDENAEVEKTCEMAREDIN